MVQKTMEERLDDLDEGMGEIKEGLQSILQRLKILNVDIQRIIPEEKQEKVMASVESKTSNQLPTECSSMEGFPQSSQSIKE